LPAAIAGPLPAGNRDGGTWHKMCQTPAQKVPLAR
jgi:hypothetical protein